MSAKARLEIVKSIKKKLIKNFSIAIEVVG